MQFYTDFTIFLHRRFAVRLDGNAKGFASKNLCMAFLSILPRQACTAARNAGSFPTRQDPAFISLKGVYLTDCLPASPRRIPLEQPF
jgi:hypothetical protein